jgi:hypothetical protein
MRNPLKEFSGKGTTGSGLPSFFNMNSRAAANNTSMKADLILPHLINQPKLISNWQ